MKFGIFPYQWGPSFDRTLRQCLLAEEMGFDSVWFGEHHGGGHGYWPSPLTALAALATRTRHVRLGTNILLLPLHDPVRVAEESAFLDSISGGRLILGVGLGYRQEEFDAFRIPMKERGRRLEEGVGLIKRLWAERQVEHKGRFYSCEGVTLSVRPRQNPGPPLWIGGWAEAAVERAARLGDGWLAGPTGSLTMLKECQAVYRNALNRSGKGNSPVEVPVTRELFVAEDIPTALREGGRHVARLYEETYIAWGVKRGWEDALLPSRKVRYEELARDRFIVGDPDQCAVQIERYRRELGMTHLICRMDFRYNDEEQVIKSMRLFAHQVMALFR